MATGSKTTKVVFFGDSLSDNGNNKKYTDKGGKVWSEVFPDLIKANAWYNFARSESKTSDLENQINKYLEDKAHPTDKAIYSLLSGGNDLKNDPFGMLIGQVIGNKNINKIINNLKVAIKKINAEDNSSLKKQFLIFNLPTTAPATKNFASILEHHTKTVYNGIKESIAKNDNLFGDSLFNDDLFGDALSGLTKVAFDEFSKVGVEKHLGEASQIVGDFIDNIDLGLDDEKITVRSVVDSTVESTHDSYSKSLKGLACRFVKEKVDVKFIDLAKHHRDIVEKPSNFGVNPDPQCLTSNGCENGLYFDLLHFSAKVTSSLLLLSLRL